MHRKSDMHNVHSLIAYSLSCKTRLKMTPRTFQIDHLTKNKRLRELNFQRKQKE